MAAWLDGIRPSVRPMTWQSYESITRTQITPRLGRIPLARLPPQHVQQMLADMLAAGLSAKYVRNVHGVLHRALDRAVQWRQLAVNPADGIALPHRQQRDMRALTPEQASAVLEAAADDPLEALWVLMLTTGCRQGELLALRWRDIDLAAGRMSVVANSVRITKRARDYLGIDRAEPLRGDPKSRRSKRVVELSALAVAALARHRTATAVIDIGGHVFTRPDGRVLPVRTMWSRWRRLCERAGVPVVRPHDARHTVATLLLGQGVHPKLVSEMLGHATVAITLDTYSHTTPAMHRQAASVLDEVLSRR